MGVVGCDTENRVLYVEEDSVESGLTGEATCLGGIFACPHHNLLISESKQGRSFHQVLKS